MLSILSAVVVTATLVVPVTPAAPVPLIIDTDICAAVDDVPALAMANLMHSKREAKLLGVMVDTKGEAGAAAVDVVNTHYKHPNIPIGALKPTDNSTCEQFAHNYAPQLAKKFPHDLRGGSAAPEATALYRALLATQKDHSVVVVSLGATTNLRNLLDADADLVRRKVSRLVVMGGQYPRSTTEPEFNFALDPAATARVVHDWPTPVVFSGGELSVSFGKRITGQSPLAETFRIGFGAGVDGELWDVLPMYYAVRGAKHFTEVRGGSNRIGAGGANEWVSPATREHSYLTLATDKAVMAKILEDMLVSAS
ncbi:nucleoside hydrolase [Allokutzneria sp. NRRL B-24872]|uniref:nucleoside hydrolase n=1 Tax=Allokutzneria sp. NRRL B-24872 TaxID=1137961 RepID=UPI00143CF3D1|nr:nucleoside hydrolase [Allokutzneria sp. NRRL B-24872]